MRNPTLSKLRVLLFSVSISSASIAEGNEKESPAEETAAVAESTTSNEEATDPKTCDPSEPDCAPCKKEKKGDTEAEPVACCDPEQSDECIDMSMKIIGVPIPIYNPQLDFALAAMGMMTYHPDKSDKISPPWSTTLFGMYASNKSWMAGGVQDMFWDKDNNRAQLIVATGKFNSDFYGTGSSTDLGVVLPLGSSMFFLKPKYMRRVWNRIYLGGQYQLMWNGTVLSPPEDADDSLTFEPIENEKVYSGLGIVAEYDTRDNRFSATEGFYTPVESMFNMEFLGSDSSYSNVSVAVNYYHSWFDKKLILASRGFMNIATDNTPVHLKPAIGRGADLRGYAYGRYRDNLLMAAQSELRWYFWWKLGAVAWGGLGTTANGFGDLDEGTVLPSYGTGLRFLAFEKQRLVIRVDYGRGNEEGLLYFSVSEAF